MEENDELVSKIVEQNAIIKALKDLAAEKTKGECKMGPWCDYCDYKMTAEHNRDEVESGRYIKYAYKSSESKICYCGKHFKECCPEWKKYEREEYDY